jgi:hypothetical protein
MKEIVEIRRRKGGSPSGTSSGAPSGTSSGASSGASSGTSSGKIKNGYYVENGKKYSGAGILLVRFDGSKKEYYFYLYRDISRGTYEDLGGNFDIGDKNIETTMRREAREESCGYVDRNMISTALEKYYDKPNKNNNTYYRGYMYFTNRFDIGSAQTILNNSTSTQKEMDDVKEMSLTEFINKNGLNIGSGESRTGNLAVVSKDGKQIILYGRTKGIIRELYKKGYFQNHMGAQNP